MTYSSPGKRKRKSHQKKGAVTKVCFKINRSSAPPKPNSALILFSLPDAHETTPLLYAPDSKVLMISDCVAYMSTHHTLM